MLVGADAVQQRVHRAIARGCLHQFPAVKGTFLEKALLVAGEVWPVLCNVVVCGEQESPKPRRRAPAVVSYVGVAVAAAEAGLKRAALRSIRSISFTPQALCCQRRPRCRKAAVVMDHRTGAVETAQPFAA